MAGATDAVTDPVRVVRPTLRCLLEDLKQEISPEELRVAARTAEGDMYDDEFYLFPVPLTDARHAVLDKANLIASDPAAPRERIEVLTDRFAVKVKTGDRRGALWQDDSGTWWLLAAGRRKDDGSGDFYVGLEPMAADSSSIAPTDADRRYEQLEAAYADECEAERAAQGLVVDALFRASREPGTTAELAVFGAAVAVRIDLDEGGLAVLEMQWTLHQFQDQDRFPADVLAMVPGRESIDLWEYLPPPASSDSPQAWFTYVPQEWVEHLATCAEIDDLISGTDGWASPTPFSDGSEHYSHWAQSKVVTLAYVSGIEIVSLCGARVVAHRDYEKLPICPTCDESLALLRNLRASED